VKYGWPVWDVEIGVNSNCQRCIAPAGSAGDIGAIAAIVLVHERYHTVGGAAISEELIPGFTVSTASYVLSLAPRKILDELQFALAAAARRAGAAIRSACEMTSILVRGGRAVGREGPGAVGCLRRHSP
jgi:phytoene dehydrogenase-like protein